MRFYTGKGDDGSTGLLFGGRVRKDAPSVEANGAVDEAQAFIGLARSSVEPGSELDQILVRVEHDLYVLMGELATLPANRSKLEAGKTLVTAAMVQDMEQVVDDLGQRFELPTEFVIPGQDRVASMLDVARTVVRRAERLALACAEPDSQVIPYLNRLSTLMWVAARWQEHGSSLRSRSVKA